MLKKLSWLLFTLALLVGPILVTKADNANFAIIAAGPNVRKEVCVSNHPPSVLMALQQSGFNPRQDDTGFIYSLLGYDGPVSSDPAAQQAFWGFWVSDNGLLTFSNHGPAQVVPQDGNLYVFDFGDGETPQINKTFADICPNQAPTPASVPTVNQAQNQTTSKDTVNYLLDNYSSQAAANQDWGAMALGAVDVNMPPTSIVGDALLSRSRHSLALAAQGIDRNSLVDQIKASYNHDQFGEPELVNDDIFAILALQATDPAWLKARPEACRTIINSQRANGAFGFSVVSDPDVDMTAAAVWALIYCQPYPSDAINRAFDYLRTTKNTDGGHGFKSGVSSNIASSAWVLLAYRAINQTDQSLEQFLNNNRQTNGSYLLAGEPNYLLTAYATMALSGKKMPIARSLNPASVPSPAVTSSPKPKSKPVSTVIETTKVIQSSPTCSASASASASTNGSTASSNASASASCF